MNLVGYATEDMVHVLLKKVSCILCITCKVERVTYKAGPTQIQSYRPDRALIRNPRNVLMIKTLIDRPKYSFPYPSSIYSRH